MATSSVSRSCLKLASSTPSASAFLQLASRRHVHLSPGLDFLAPRIASRHISQTLNPRATRQSSRSIARRAFSSSISRSATIAIYNPKQDDDGKDMNVEITARAAKRLKEIMAKDSNPALALRITVESGGCHGFQYLMSLTTLPLPLAPVSEGASLAPNTSSAETTVAAPPAIGEKKSTPALDEDDTVFEADDGSQARVVMDGPSLELLKGSKIDYTMELIGSQFKIVDNPLATSSCGCGTSFDIKM